MADIEREVRSVEVVVEVGRVEGDIEIGEVGSFEVGLEDTELE
ncbi:MAG: hypothetical protein S4CHLAM20_15350 [Chlamydiia bacterium]|nr:hypothetical protein [Chlamydiia bacterium]